MVVKKSLIIVMLVCLIAQASALSIDINIQEGFNSGEEITFDYTIEGIDGLVVYDVGIRCPQTIFPESIEKGASLNGSLSESYSTYLLENPESQTCTAFVEVNDLVEEKEFKILGEKTFSFFLNFEKKIFILGENIKIDYTSDITPEIDALLIYPDKTEKQISLPYESIAEQIGNYRLEVVAIKEGYQDVEVIEEFAVIKEKVVIEEERVCKIDGKCKEGEDNSNCPQDCAIKSLKPGAYNLYKGLENLIYFGFVVVLVALIAGLILLILKYKKLAK